MVTKLLRGEPTTVLFAAPADHDAGDIVVVGNVPFIAINRGKSGQPAAFAAGGGCYQMPASEVSGDEPTPGMAAYVDSDLVGDVTQGGKHLGYCVSVNGDTCVIYHQPNGTAV
ncbi:hypothetical protein [Allorhodopirellula heiligendammensis]|uniref:DUF2190 family protein n=1 Tax=Allorhodopirellula heiligendammensis TaxID=2714739 RepID=A0A5C6C3W9_9BACT|nr:hypothetical protein [Allorhodopirellula heiligendammensis]TWU17994.1 hypothetical protein Poly21_01470 [Allorhodopirellula heiligendammensis]